ncbi:MAG: toll/interleukin-1 receptor domain-containing protein [Chloroflexota bacterium]
MTTPSNSVFISYRRDVAGIYVLAVYQHLSASHVDAFYDTESIKAGQFGEIILGQIAARPYFMPIFTPNTLDRCTDSNDWVRREIEHALSLNRVLIPLHTPDFDFDDLERYLPHLATTIRGFNMVELPINQLKYFKYAMQDVVENYLKPITLTLTTPSSAAAAEVASAKHELDVTPAVTEKQLTAQEYFRRALARPGNDLDGIIADYSESIRLRPNNPTAFNNRGIARQNKGDWAGAITDYSEAIRLRPNSALPYNNRGYVRVLSGDPDSAIIDCTEAIRLKPDFAIAYDSRGDARAAKGDLDGAIKDYFEAIRLKPDDAEFYYNRGNAYTKKEDWTNAIADYRRCLELNANHPQAKTMRHYIIKYGRG